MPISIHHLLAALAAAGIATGSAHAESRNFAVAGFDRIKVAGSSDVDVMTGNAASVTAQGSPAALDRLDIRVEANKLIIGSKSGSWGSHNDGKVRISVIVPALRGIELSGSADLKVDRAKAADFAVTVGGSGEAKVTTLDVETVSINVGGSGSFKAEGNCNTASVQIGGSGDVYIGGLKCRTLTASIGGSGNLDGYASESASIAVAGSGDARIRGGGQCKIAKSGSGSVDCN